MNNLNALHKLIGDVPEIRLGAPIEIGKEINNHRIYINRDVLRVGAIYAGVIAMEEFLLGYKDIVATETGTKMFSIGIATNITNEFYYIDGYKVKLSETFDSIVIFSYKKTIDGETNIFTDQNLIYCTYTDSPINLTASFTIPNTTLTVPAYTTNDDGTDFLGVSGVNELLGGVNGTISSIEINCLLNKYQITHQLFTVTNNNGLHNASIKDYIDMCIGLINGKSDTRVGIPTGGTTGQILKKKSNAEYDAEWGNESVNSVNSKTGTVVLTASDVGADESGSALTVQTNLDTHTSNTENPHSVTKAQIGLGNVDNTADLNKPISTAVQSALDLKANLTAISNINNTADLDKPISTAVQSALDLKANLTAISNINNTADLDKPISTAVQNALNLKANLADISNIDNTADLNKPISTAVQSALDLKVDLAAINNINNTADLDKPISTATQTALNAKANISIVPKFKQITTNASNFTGTASPYTVSIEDSDITANSFVIIYPKTVATETAFANLTSKVVSVSEGNFNFQTTSNATTELNIIYEIINTIETVENSSSGGDEGGETPTAIQAGFPLTINSSNASQFTTVVVNGKNVSYLDLTGNFGLTTGQTITVTKGSSSQTLTVADYTPMVAGCYAAGGENIFNFDSLGIYDGVHFDATSMMTASTGNSMITFTHSTSTTLAEMLSSPIIFSSSSCVLANTVANTSNKNKSVLYLDNVDNVYVGLHIDIWDVTDPEVAYADREITAVDTVNKTITVTGTIGSVIQDDYFITAKNAYVYNNN